MSGFETMLADYDAVARRAALDHLSRVSRSPHLSPPVVDYVERPGKGLRPALCMATCEAFGALSLFLFLLSPLFCIFSLHFIPSSFFCLVF